MSENLSRIASLIRANNKPQARQELIEILREDPTNDQAWLYMAACAANKAEFERSIQQALRINPLNKQALRQAEKHGIELPEAAQALENTKNTKRGRRRRKDKAQKSKDTSTKSSTSEGRSGGRRLLPLLLLLIIIIGGALGAFVLLNQDDGDASTEVIDGDATEESADAPTPTNLPRNDTIVLDATSAVDIDINSTEDVVDEPTEIPLEATATPTIIPTEAATETPTTIPTEIPTEAPADNSADSADDSGSEEGGLTDLLSDSTAEVIPTSEGSGDTLLDDNSELAALPPPDGAVADDNPDNSETLFGAPAATEDVEVAVADAQAVATALESASEDDSTPTTDENSLTGDTSDTTSEAGTAEDDQSLLAELEPTPDDGQSLAGALEPTAESSEALAEATEEVSGETLNGEASDSEALPIGESDNADTLLLPDATEEVLPVATEEAEAIEVAEVDASESADSASDVEVTSYDPPVIQLVYDPTVIYLKNISEENQDISTLEFRQVVDDSEFLFTTADWQRPLGEGYRGVGSTYALQPDSCFQLGTDSVIASTRNRECVRLVSWLVSAIEGEFWVLNNGSVRTFFVYAGEEPIAECEIDAGLCEFGLPPVTEEE